MRKASFVMLTVLLVAGAFLAGSWYARGKGGGAGSPAGRRILYYVDPMHPAYKSDKPGVAPDCGMQLEPVFEDGGQVGSGGGTPSMPPGSVSIDPGKRQAIGVRVETVGKVPTQHTLRVLGRVAADETRLYRINATTDGWITKTYPNSAGSVVRKDEVLAAFYSPEFLSGEQALLYALNSKDRVQTTGRENPGQVAQLEQFEVNLRQYRDSLRNLGMGDRQIEELIRTRQYMENVDVTSPADGVILARNVSQGQRFDKGTEMYRIADLSRVWVLADVYENEARYLKPGMAVKATQANLGRPSARRSARSFRSSIRRRGRSRSASRRRTRGMSSVPTCSSIWRSRFACPRPLTFPRRRSSTPGCGRRSSSTGGTGSSSPGRSRREGAWGTASRSSGG